MALVPGQTLAHYEILGSLGAGAMGEVYRAHDTRLDRDVALKVLPEELASDEERLQRFDREARTLAHLNHPNVEAIYAVDRVGGLLFLALELVPGEDLAERLRRGALPLDEALDVCRQIADGLEAAHEAGIVHRDLKPANVRLTPEGVVKILDFGLAKPLGPAAASEPHEDSVLVTEEGLLLGTPTYMSPEQARGKPVDRRADVWAFGCVLYECLTGVRAFAGASLGELVATILGSEADLSLLPPRTPEAVRTLVARALTKDPRARLRDVGEARVVLESTRVGAPAPRDPAAPAAPGLRRAAPRPALALAAGALLGLGTGFLARSLLSVGEVEAAPRATSIHVPEDRALQGTDVSPLALAPDGRTVAWVHGRIHVRPLDSFEIRALPGTEGGVGPFFSPDSQRVGFWRDGQLLSISLHGGTPTTIVEAEGRNAFFRGASWGDDGTIVVAPSLATGLFRVPAAGGELEPLTEVDLAAGERTHRYPHVLPGGEVVLYTRDDDATVDYFDDAFVVARSLATGEERVVVEGAGQARYAAGRIVFVRGADLYAQPFDARALRVSGVPRRIVSGVECSAMSGAASFDLARDGALAYAPGLDRSQALQLAWLRTGEEPELLDLAPGPFGDPRLSPDGRFASYVCRAPDRSELWLLDLERGRARLRTSDAQLMGHVWAPGSDRLFFGTAGGRPAVHEVDQLGASAPRLVHRAEPGASFLLPHAVTPDGRTLLATLVTDDDSDVLAVDVAAGTASERIATPAEEGFLALDPSGRWLAFTSSSTGAAHVFATTLEPGGPVLQVSQAPSISPRWSPDGAALYFVRRSTFDLWAVDVEPGETLAFGPPRLVLEDVRDYDVAADGRVLSFVDLQAAEAGREIRVQSAWLAEVGPR